MDKWITIKGYEVLVIDGKVKRAIKTDDNGERVTRYAAYVYRKYYNNWVKQTGLSPAAVRAGMNRGTIKIV